jgi:LPS-assembly protein
MRNPPGLSAQARSGGPACYWRADNLFPLPLWERVRVRGMLYPPRLKFAYANSRLLPHKGGAEKMKYIFVFVFALFLTMNGALRAQTENVPFPGFSNANDPNAQMLLQADELITNNDNSTVTASGNVQIFYNGYNVIAKRVVYNKKTRRVLATGDVRITDSIGNVYFSESADLTENFSDGFVRSLRMERIDRTHFAADSAERKGGNLTIFNRGVYTACEPCKEHPEKPPLWQVKAARIISNQKEQMIYFEDATIEFFGMPIAYVPYFWTPDATVKRKSGFLSPGFYYNKRIGEGMSTPYYFALSPFYDLTFTPTFLTNQGVHTDLLWRHSLPNGDYQIRATGIYQLDPNNVGVGSAPAPPLTPDAGAERWRGSLQTKGKFLLTDKWTFGWDASLDSDPRYLKDYGYAPLGATERVSTLYLQGKGDRSFFDARAYYFRDLIDTNTDPRERQGIQPIVAPAIDYNTAMADPYLGGEFHINSNLTHVTREEQLSYAVGDPDGLAGPLPAAKYLTPGFAGDYTRLSMEAGWRKTFTDPIGQRITPFWSVRGDLYRYDVANTVPQVDDLSTASALTGGDTLANTIPSLLANDGDANFRGMPTIGVDYRYPFIATSGSTTHIFEPIVQLIARPNEQQIGQVPNEDAHSLVFDDTDLFEVDKFSGYDRMEGGSRLNAGMQYTMQTQDDFKLSALFGQSYQLGGLNSFAQGALDLNGTGFDSGLETNTSDYVARLYVQPNKNSDFAARFRFDDNDFSLERVELDGRLYYGPLFASAAYVRRAAQPNLGINTPLEEVSGLLSYALNDTWSIYAGGRYSLQNVALSNPDWVSNQIGVRYTDECFTISLDYSRIYSNFGDIEPQEQLMLRFNLRTLGDGQLRTKLGGI